MERGAVKTLFLPFENGDLPFPVVEERWLFLNAELPHPSLHRWQNVLVAVQGFRPAFLELKNAGFAVVPSVESQAHNGAIILLGKHRTLNRQNIYAATERTLAGGSILVSGAKTSGVQAMRKEMSALVAIEQTHSKNHAQVFRFSRPENWVSPHLDPVSTVSFGDSKFETAPGMFSHKSVDQGSDFLVKHMAGVTGRVADFGAGWGYLSAVLLARNPGVTSLDLYEADHASLEAARKNLMAAGGERHIGFHWFDIRQERVPSTYDVVVMNPPFHSGRKAEFVIGQRFIEAASAALKPGGRLMMVANKQLPYEDTLQANFRRFARIDEDRQYKIIEAVK